MKAVTLSCYQPHTPPIPFRFLDILADISSHCNFGAEHAHYLVESYGPRLLKNNIVHPEVQP